MSELQKTKNNDLKSLLSGEDVQQRLQSILGKRASTFSTSVLQIVQSNEMLKNAAPSSVLGAAMTSATLNLPLNNNLGYAYIIPFNEKQKNGQYLVKAQLQIGYKGFIQLCQRSGQFKFIHVTDVKQGEIISRDRLSGEMDFQWVDDDNEREKLITIGYVAYFKLLNGYEATLFMSIKELESHGKKFSQTYKKNFGLWKDDFDSMAKKTVLKLLLTKYAPMSVEMQTAQETDQASVEWNEEENTIETKYVDNEPPQHDEEEERITTFLKNSNTMDDLDIIRPQHDEEEERITTFLKNSTTIDDLDIIRPQISDKYQSLFDEAEERILNAKK